MGDQKLTEYIILGALVLGFFAGLVIGLIF